MKARDALRTGRDDLDRAEAAAPVEPTPAVDPLSLLDLQRSAGNAAVVQLLRQAGRLAEQGRSPVAVHDVLRTGGRPLDAGTRADMEARLGADFSDVRVHDDGTARESAGHLGALAYTSGNHIVLGDGATGAHTLAHELTHVIQQRQGPVAGADNGGGLSVSDPADRFERAAEADARRVTSGSAPTAGPAAFPPAAAESPQPAAAVQRMVGGKEEESESEDEQQPPQEVFVAEPAPRGTIQNLEQISYATLLTMARWIDAQTAVLADAEISQRFIDLDTVAQKRQELDELLAELRDDKSGAETYTLDELKKNAVPALVFKTAAVAYRLRKLLNDSFTNHDEVRRELLAATADQPVRQAKPPGAPVRYESPYAKRLDRYDDKFEGAPVLVEDNFVIVVEHYQLKHSPWLGILQAAGPFIGKSGSKLPGGWEEHRNTYAPLVLAMAREEVAKLNNPGPDVTLKPGKKRVDNLEVYLSITREGNDWIVTYHGNPPPT